MHAPADPHNRTPGRAESLAGDMDPDISSENAEDPNRFILVQKKL
jgi:hypothetical protein